MNAMRAERLTVGVVAAGRIARSLPPEQQVAVQLKYEQAVHAAAIEFALCRAISYLALEVFP
jgi:hypothetical protein